MTRLAIALSVVLMITSPVVAQNLLVNPGFDNPDLLNGWTCSTTYGQANWITNDRLGAPTSGAMEHFISAPTINEAVFCIQCIPVDEFYTYVASVWHYWPDDPDVTQVGTVRMGILVYPEAGCTGTLLNSTVNAGYHPALDTWYRFSTDEIVAPAGSVSARFAVSTHQDPADQWVRTRLDDLDFSATTLFRDGFESGGTGAWSSTSP